jgi:hypothetical protein
VFLIIGENTTYSHLTAANAPYLMGTIRPQAAWLTSYYAATHWSQASAWRWSPGSSPGASKRTGASPAIRTSATSSISWTSPG